MPVQSFDHYNLRAPRELLEQLRAFYCEVVGLSLGARPPFTQFGYWLYTGDRPVLHLTQADEGESRSAAAVATFGHAAFGCTGRKDFERRLSERGIAYETADVPLTSQVQLFFHDPAGNGVELNFDSADA